MTLLINLPHFIWILAGRDDPTYRISLRVIQQELYRFINTIWWANGRGRAELHHDIWLVTFIILQPVQCVDEYREVGGIV